MSRKASVTGPLVTGFTLTGGGTKCIDDTGGATTPGTVQIDTCSSTSTAQKWTIGTDSTVKVLGLRLDTNANSTAAGALIVIDTCNTDATQKWKVTTNGTLVSNAENTRCLADPSASATNGTQLTLATCGSTGQTWHAHPAGPELSDVAAQRQIAVVAHNQLETPLYAASMERKALGLTFIRVSRAGPPMSP
ncbi:RICIN domain-containing protein [Streptomyces sp. PA03-1a]|nr:RICIN domain-containing protein [Streptomyces sp. PA03-1a]